MKSVRKALLFAPMIILCLALSACGGEKERPHLELQDWFRDLDGITAEAEVTAQYADEARTYTMTCIYTPEEAQVEVTAPAEAAGITAGFSGEEMTLSFDGLTLDAGEYSGTEVSPLWSVPALFRGVAEGYALEWSREKVGEESCLRITFEVTGEEGEPLYHTVWFRSDGTPVYGEITVRNAVVYMINFTNFTTEERGNGTTAEENMGGD